MCKVVPSGESWIARSMHFLRGRPDVRMIRELEASITRRDVIPQSQGRGSDGAQPTEARGSGAGHGMQGAERATSGKRG